MITFKKKQCKKSFILFFSDKVNIKNFDPNLLKIDKISFKNTDVVVYSIKYIMMESGIAIMFIYI